MSIYHEHIMDHYKHPRNSGSLESPHYTITDSNPLCGDSTTVFFIEQQGKITQARQFTQGCALAQAGASILFEQLEGKTKEDILAIPKEAILEEFGTELSVSRVKCALLGWSAARKALTLSTPAQHITQTAGAKPPGQQEEHDARD
jgi:nitrogen fixation protein NifU and related proteins